MARLLLIRHAPTPETGHRLTGRLPGVGLDETGWAIARGLAERLRSVRLRAVYASPIERTWQTAQALAEPHRLEPVRCDGLLEVDYGRWQGRTLASLARLEAWQKVQHSPSSFSFPEGESLAAAQSRGVETCLEIAGAHRKSTVALVTHADIIRLVLSFFLGQPLDLFQRLTVAPASVSVVDIHPGRAPRVLAVNTDGDQRTWR